MLNRNSIRLFLSSFLLLFVELTLIRWAGANIYALSYFSNFILIASFLGIGLGFIRAQYKGDIFKYSPIVLTLLIAITHYYSYQYQVNFNIQTNDLDFTTPYFKDNLIPVELTLPLIFIAVTVVMTTLADGVARYFKLFSPLNAYRLEILGSLSGVVLFSSLAFFQTSPSYWGIVIVLLFVTLLYKEWRWNRFVSVLQLTAVILLLFTFQQQSSQSGNAWSPYYKIHTLPYSHDRTAVIVNGWPQQFIESVAQRKQYKSFYFAPYQHLPPNTPLDHVLVIGAGTGGDVAIALAEGAKQIDAVEIDPKLYAIGKDIHPNQPYQDPRVHIHIGDGRAFLQHTSQYYDLIIFALPDSLMILSGLSSIRLENYLFTLENFALARQHLTAHGVMTMYNYYREKWFVDRLGKTLVSTFQHAPCLDTEGEANHWLSVLTISKSPTFLQCSTPWVETTVNKYTTPTSDDHPFLYVKERVLSGFYFFALITVLMISVSGIRIAGISLRSISRYADLFFMGTAFLLLEAKSVTTFALLFGSTWFVNALVFMGVLFSIYLAIEAVNYKKIPSLKLLYSGLLGALFIAWLTPNSILLILPFYLRFVVAIVLAFTPIFIANVIFAERFRQTQHSTEAFGVNVLGAVIGGLLEYSSIILGYRNLLIVVGFFYLLAILKLQRSNLQEHYV